jgi:predicted HAD superfamily Cof-like phosphohydrolase
MVEDRFVSDVGAFHAKFGIDQLEPAAPAVPSDEMMGFRLNFMLEELNEIAAANDFVLDVDKQGEVKFTKCDPDLCEHESDEKKLVHSLDGLVDLLYVLMGTVRLMGFHTNSPWGQRFHAAWGRVQAANMRKVRATEADQSKRKSTLDIVKPEGWVGPDLRELV